MNASSWDYRTECVIEQEIRNGATLVKDLVDRGESVGYSPEKVRTVLDTMLSKGTVIMDANWKLKLNSNPEDRALEAWKARAELSKPLKLNSSNSEDGGAEIGDRRSKALTVALQALEAWKAREQELLFRESLLRDYLKSGITVYQRSNCNALILEKKISLTRGGHQIDGWLVYNVDAKDFREVPSSDIVSAGPERDQLEATRLKSQPIYTTPTAWDEVKYLVGVYGAVGLVSLLLTCLLHFWY